MAVFQGLAPDRRSARFGKLWEALGVDIKLWSNAPKAVRHLIFVSVFNIRVEQMIRGELIKRKNG